MYILKMKGVTQMQTAIVKWGNSRGIRLPKPLLESVHMSDSDTVEVTAVGDSIVIKKTAASRMHKTIQERFEGFTGEYEPVEIDWGEPVGKEIW